MVTGSGAGLDPDRLLTKALDSRTAQAFARLGLTTVWDLITYYPRRYHEPGTYTPIAALDIGRRITIVARIARVASRTMASKPDRGVFTVTVSDGTSEIDLVFFVPLRQLEWRKRMFRPGLDALCTGVVGEFRGRLQLVHPDIALATDGFDTATVEQRTWPVPIYAASKALPSWNIAKAVATVLDPLRETDLVDPVPAELRERYEMPGLVEALRLVHRPRTLDEPRAALRRLRYQEALIVQVAMAQRRAASARQATSPRPRRSEGVAAALDARLPFELTRSQVEVGEVVSAELAGEHPMHRLLQGEVGSGKTVVALRAMAQVADAGGQAALLAPTEVLAQQHERTIRTLLGPLADEGLFAEAGAHVSVRLLTGAMPAAARRQVLAELASGEAGIVVGTHALLSDPVEFADLALVVVDEQHRFGVEQRDLLREKAGAVPHTLVMTATPIPRTVAIAMFGDLDLSELREIPAGRPGVITHLVPADNPAWMARVWSRLAEEVAAGRRGYVVCPRIDENDVVVPDADEQPSLASVIAQVEELRRNPVLGQAKIGMLHGRMSSADKDAAMLAFAAGDIDVLVCTTVVEVGVDVPEASTMVVLDADRFGLSQLHQLRGRVGRGTVGGLALLVSGAAADSAAGRRLTLLAELSDGFALAEQDLVLRREGDILGAAQWGRTFSVFRALRLARDADIIEMAREDAIALVGADAELSAQPGLAAAVARTLAGREEFLGRA